MTSTLSMENPVIVAYAIAAALMVLKIMGQGWMTVALMMKTDAGFLNPEDLRLTPANRNPRPEQLDLNPNVERSRRMHRNDLENIPAFLVCGLLFVLLEPPYWPAVLLFSAFVWRGWPILSPTPRPRTMRCEPPSIRSLPRGHPDGGVGAGRRAVLEMGFS